LVEIFYDNGSVWIMKIDEEKIPIFANGYQLKFPKDEFTDSIRKDLNLIESIRAPNPFNLYPK